MTEGRSGFVAVVGRPNVGKSTLVNSLVGHKVAITSSRPQTTRNALRGVLTIPEPPAQLVFVDTPGFHKPRTALGERLNRLVSSSLADTDAALFVLDATQAVGPGDRLIAQRIVEAGVSAVVAVNKVDLATPAQVAEQLVEAGAWDFAAYVPVSALEGEGARPLIEELIVLVPHGPFFFPPEMTTDQPDRLLAAEIVREKYLVRLRDELPHSLVVVTDEMEVREGGTVYLAATVYVERESQKGMVIGKGGSMVGAVGKEARQELETIFEAPIYLDLRVRVEKDWQRRETLLDRLGF